MSEMTCDFGNLLKTPCNKLDFSRTSGIKKLSDFNQDDQEEYLWRAGLSTENRDGMTICFHHEQVFGNVFRRRADKCCGVLMKHRRKVKGEKVITLQMARQLQAKDVNVTPGHMFCHQCVLKFKSTTNTDSSGSEVEDHLLDEIDDVVNESDSADEFNVCETPRKKLNTSLETIGISPVNLHGIPQHSRPTSAKMKLEKVMNTFKSNISDAYQVGVESLDDSDSVIAINEIQEKATELGRLHDAMKEKLVTASYSEKIQILTLAPDSWPRKYCSEYFNVSEYLVRTARELKNVGGILVKPAPKKGKTISQETLDLVLNFYEDDEFSRQMPGKKDCVSVGNKVQKQKRLVLCNLREMYCAFKGKYPNVKLGFSKFCTLRPKWCVLAGSTGTHSVCVCSTHQNAILLVDAIDWDVTYKDLINKVVCNSDNKICMMHRCESCPGNAGLKNFLDEELSELDMSSEFHYCQWDTTDRASLTTLTTTYEEYKEIVIETINNLTRHSYLSKCQAKYLKSKKETLGENEALVLGDFAENYQFLIQDEIQSYHWSKEYCTLHPLVVYYRDTEGNLQHDSLCFISDDNTHDTSFVYQIQTMLVDYLKETHTHIKKIVYFSDGCGGQYKNYKNFMNLCFHKHDFGIDAEWVFFATSHGKSPCDGIGGAVKRHTAKRSLQRPLNNQILDYEAMLALCREKMTSIKFFGISKESMNVVRKYLEKRYEDGKTVPGTRSSHHFIPLSSSQLGHKLTSEDESFIDKHDFNVPTFVDIGDINPSSYVTCVYNSFWWVGMVTHIDQVEGDVKIDFMHPHGPRKTFHWPQGGDLCYVPVKNIVHVISTPTTCTGRSYKIADVDYKKTVAAFEKLHA